MPRAQIRRSSRPAGRRRSAYHAGGERRLPGVDTRRGVRPTFLRAPTEEPAARIGQRTRRGECPRQLRALMRAHARARTENRISVARRDYIDSVRAYNTELKTFPGVIWASTLY